MNGDRLSCRLSACHAFRAVPGGCYDEERPPISAAKDAAVRIHLESGDDCSLRIKRKAYEVPMSDVRQIVSPDGRYALLLASHEMRMSHWVTSAALWERSSERLLLQLGDGLWSSEEIAWSTDSRVVTVGLRRYPGDAPEIVLEIYPEQQIIIPRAPAEAQPLPFAQLNTFLERYYAQHRRERP